MAALGQVRITQVPWRKIGDYSCGVVTANRWGARCGPSDAPTRKHVKKPRGQSMRQESKDGRQSPSWSANADRENSLPRFSDDATSEDALFAALELERHDDDDDIA